MLFSNTDNEIFFVDYQEQLDKSLTQFVSELSSVRAGRANARILDKLMVDYYGVSTPVNQISNIMCPDPRTIMIAPWDINAIKEIVKAIQVSDLGLNPSDDGKIVRLSLPILTEERRKDLVKQVKKICEDRKVAMRNMRRDCLDEYKKLKKDNKISENEMEMVDKEVQKTLDNYTKKIDDYTKNKENEIMDI